MADDQEMFTSFGPVAEKGRYSAADYMQIQVEQQKGASLGTRLFAKAAMSSPTKSPTKGGIIDRVGLTSSQQIM